MITGSGELISEEDENGEEKEQPLSDEAKQAGKKMQLSYTLRMFLIAGIAALAVGIVAALLGGSLLTVAGACCAAVFLLELIFT